MQNLNKNSGCGIAAGNIALFILPIDELASISIINITTRQAIPMTGKTFGKVEAANIATSATFDSGAYNHEISCTLHGHKHQHDSTLDDMTRRRWIAKVVDSNGAVWIHGSKEEPLSFSWAHISDAKPSEEHAYKLTFSAHTTEPPYATTL
mgnify:CR=1 FL=1